MTRSLLVTLASAACLGCSPSPVEPPPAVIALQPVQSEPARPRPPFTFSAEDERLLDEVERGCFNFFWHGGVGPAGLAPDRTSTTAASVAGIGYQLGAICVGAQRGWVTRQEAADRCVRILRTIAADLSVRKAGMYYHFLDGNTGGQPKAAYERVVSTIDSAILFSGVLTASSYFGGDVAKLGDAIFEEADWQFFVARKLPKGAPSEGLGAISLAWKPTDEAKPAGEGSLLHFYWLDAGDEQKLVTFLAASAPLESHRVDPKAYYKLRRVLGDDGDGPFVWFPWSGALFTHFFAHVWIDYAHMGPDDPAAMGVQRRPRVDWWENSLRAARMHRRRCAAKADTVPNFAAGAWGLSASDAVDGYAVPGLFPTPLSTAGLKPNDDFAPVSSPKDYANNYGDGTVGVYAAACTIMFESAPAVDAIRRYRALATGPMAALWKDPAQGGWGFQDAFNVKLPNGEAWVAPDVVAIDQGPMILAIENARTGLIWKTFGAHRWVKAGRDRLKLP